MLMVNKIDLNDTTQHFNGLSSVRFILCLLSSTSKKKNKKKTLHHPRDPRLWYLNDLLFLFRLV